MKGLAVALVQDVIETFYKLRKQEVVTSDEIMELLKRARPDITEADVRKALMVLELHGKIYVKRVVKGGKDVYQITRRQ